MASGGATGLTCYTGPFPFTNVGALSCITVGGTSFAGNVVNSGTGVISPGNPTGILVTNASTVTGQISNAGSISVSGTGIRVDTDSVVTNGIVNTGTITSGTSAAGIQVVGVSTFAGGITNTGTIAAAAFGAGIVVTDTTVFTGGITNTGTIVAAPSGVGIAVGGPGIGVPTFTGGIVNTGTIGAGATGILLANVGTFSGGISSSGTIAAGSIGIDICFCVGTFTGGITNAGLISAGRTGIAVSATRFDGGILNTGTITARRTGIFVEGVATFTGGITNAGVVQGRSAGIVVASSGFLPASVTFTGGITNSGTIAAGRTGIFVGFSGGFGGGITNAGLISLASNGVGISIDFVSQFAGGITNSGTITGGAAGMIICGCVGTFSGGITNTGVISARSAGIVVEAASFDGHIVNSGTISAATAIDVSFAQNAIKIDQNAGMIAGDILFSSFGDTLTIRGGAVNGNIVGQNAGDTINFSLGAGHTFIYDAAFGFQSVSTVNVNSGTVILNGNNGAGSTAINGGLLQVGDAGNPGATLTSSVDVIGGTLSGHGTVVGDVTIENGGVLFPGGSIGTLTINNGPLTFNTGSTYLVQIRPGAGSSSATAVTGAPGNVVINGGNVLALPQLGHYTATSYQIITSNGGLTGTFAGVGFAAPFTFTGTASLSYPDGFDAFLNLTDGFALFTPTGLNQNQQSVVNGINGAILGGTTPPAQFQNLTSLSGPTLLNALSQLSGENGAGFQRGALQAADQFLSLLLNPYIDGRDDTFTPAIPFAAEQRPALPDATLAFAQFVKANPRDATLGSAPQFRVWGAAYGGSGTIDGNAAVGSQRTSASDAAFAAGVDYLLSRDTTFGFALAGGGTNWGLDGGLGNGRSDMFQAGLYARHRFGDAYVAGALAYNFHDVTTTRTVTVAGTDTLQGRFQANGLGARIEGGYHIAMPFVRLTPYGAVQVQSIFLPSYGETATAGSNQFALNYAAQTATTTRTELGSWIDRSFLDHGHLWTFYGRAAWAHDFGDTPNVSAIFQTLPGSNFVVNGAAPNADSALVTAGTKYDLLNGWSFQVKFDGDFSSNSSIYGGTGMVRKTW
ncbi:MAG TPA: autotransporter domain-containing protein [Xanthobacteraceae bacterium]